MEERGREALGVKYRVRLEERGREALGVKYRVRSTPL
jgi:hypothetical protein